MSTQRPNVDSVLGNTFLQRNNIYLLITQKFQKKQKKTLVVVVVVVNISMIVIGVP